MSDEGKSNNLCVYKPHTLCQSNACLSRSY